MEFPSADVDNTSAFGGEFGEVPPLTPSLSTNHSPTVIDGPQSTLDHEASIDTVTADTTINDDVTTETETVTTDTAVNDAAAMETTQSCVTPTNEPTFSEPITVKGSETNPDGHAVTIENKPEATGVEPQDTTLETSPESETISEQPSVEKTVSKETLCIESRSDLTEEPKPMEEQVLSDDQSLAQLSAPEVKSISKKVRRTSLSKEGGVSSPGKRHHSRTNSESKIHITVSSSMKIGEIVEPTNGKKSDGVKSMDEKVASMLKDVQTKLREKDGEIKKLKEHHEKTIRDKNDQIKKQAKDNKKIEREKWELLKRARDAAERALHLRTQLDLKEGTIRGIQSELDRTKDELFSVKSANTSLRALLSELRAPRKAGVEVGVQVDSGTATLKRNKSMELAFTAGGLSQEQQGKQAHRFNLVGLCLFSSLV